MLQVKSNVKCRKQPTHESRKKFGSISSVSLQVSLRIVGINFHCHTPRERAKFKHSRMNGCHGIIIGPILPASPQNSYTRSQGLLYGTWICC